MRLTKKNKNKIDRYFDNLKPEQLTELIKEYYVQRAPTVVNENDLLCGVIARLWGGSFTAKYPKVETVLKAYRNPFKECGIQYDFDELEIEMRTKYKDTNFSETYKLYRGHTSELPFDELLKRLKWALEEAIKGAVANGI